MIKVSVNIYLSEPEVRKWIQFWEYSEEGSANNVTIQRFTKTAFENAVIDAKKHYEEQHPNEN